MVSTLDSAVIPVTVDPPARWGRYGRRPLVALALLGLVEGLERRVLPAVLPLVQDDLGFSDLQAGLLDSAIIVAALLIAVPAGVLADRLDRRRFIAGTFLVWSGLVALTGTVRSFGQLLGLRALLGAGDAINDPAAQSLLADYYRPERRGRVYGIQRVMPTVGAAFGLGLGSAVGAAFGWRVAVTAMAVPGVLVALLVLRLREPARGGSEPAPPVPVAALPGPQPQVAPALSTRAAVRQVLAIPTVRALVLATSVTTAILLAVAFWGVTYTQRATGLSLTEAGAVTGIPVLLGAVLGSLGGGYLVDRLRRRVVGAAMLLAGVFTGLGSLLFAVSFLDGLPVYTVRLPLQALSVALLIGSLPATTAMTSEVVPAALRGTAFGVLKLASNVLAALFPPLVGLIADLNRIVLPGGEIRGDLGFAFRCVLPLLLVASVLLLRGRRHVARDTALARGADPALLPAATPLPLTAGQLIAMTVAVLAVALLAAALLS